MSDNYRLHTDGGARGNPGHAAIGYVVKDSHNKKLFESSEYIGETTNNIAEYRALIAGLKYSIKEGIKSIDCYLDSELVVKQLNKKYKVKNANLKMLYEDVVSLAKSFNNINFIHVKREENKEADQLVNIELDKRENHTK